MLEPSVKLNLTREMAMEISQGILFGRVIARVYGIYNSEWDANVIYGWIHHCCGMPLLRSIRIFLAALGLGKEEMCQEFGFEKTYRESTVSISIS